MIAVVPPTIPPYVIVPEPAVIAKVCAPLIVAVDAKLTLLLVVAIVVAAPNVTALL